MKYYCIIFLTLLFTQLKAEMSEDTCKVICVETMGDHKSMIVNKLFSCFENANFDSLAPYCKDEIDFIIQTTDSTTRYERVTEYKMIQDFDNMFRKLSYRKFKILSTKTKSNEDIILVELYMFDDPFLDLYFLLNDKGAIRTVFISPQ